jgi:hypothetical protein
MAAPYGGELSTRNFPFVKVSEREAGRSGANVSWMYMGCSDQSVPSLSKTATRSGVGTKSGEP